MELEIFSHATLVLSQGFLLCAGLIIAIGPQNLFILQQVLRGQHLFATALLCTLADLCLISLGIGGLGSFITANQLLLSATTISGAAFLIGYGVYALRSAFRFQAADNATLAPRLPQSLPSTIVATLSFSLLNPAAYIDTVLMIGTTSVHYSVDERILFGAGAILASALWFFTLTYASSRLTLIFRSPLAWRTLDLVSGCIMIGIAMSMSLPQHIGDVVAMAW